MSSSEMSITAEVDRRFDELFGEDEPKEDDPDQTLPDSEINPEASPIFALKSAVLAVDWEITDEILENFSEEVKKASEHLNEFKKARSLLKLLDSLARYIRRRKGSAHPDSIKRLHSVYDSLEMIVTEPSLTKSQISAIVAKEVEGFRSLKQAINQYHPSENRESEADDGDAQNGEDETEEAATDEEVVIPAVNPDLQDTYPYKNLEEALVKNNLQEEDVLDDSPTEPTITQSRNAEEIERLAEEEPFVIEEGDLDLSLDDIAPPENISEMSPHEAFALALEEIRKTIQAEFSALRAELRMWRMEKM